MGAIIIWSLSDFVGLATYKEWNCVHFNIERQIQNNIVHIFTWNKYLIHRTIGLNTWWRNLCWQAQRSDVCCSFSAGLHRSWEGFWSLLVADQDLNMNLFEPHLCCHGRRFGSFSVLSLREGGCRPKMSWYMAPFNLPRYGEVVLSLSWETPPKHKVSTSMLHSGDGVLGVVLSISLLQTRQVELMPNSSILVSSDHITFSQASSGSSRCSLATSDGPVHVPSSAEDLARAAGFLIFHGVVCYWWFSSWLWSQLPSGLNKLLCVVLGGP